MGAIRDALLKEARTKLASAQAKLSTSQLRRDHDEVAIASLQISNALVLLAKAESPEPLEDEVKPPTPMASSPPEANSQANADQKPPQLDESKGLFTRQMQPKGLIDAEEEDPLKHRRRHRTSSLQFEIVLQVLQRRIEEAQAMSGRTASVPREGRGKQIAQAGETEIQAEGNVIDFKLAQSEAAQKRSGQSFKSYAAVIRPVKATDAQSAAVVVARVA